MVRKKYCESQVLIKKFQQMLLKLERLIFFLSCKFKNVIHVEKRHKKSKWNFEVLKRQKNICR